MARNKRTIRIVAQDGDGNTLVEKDLSFDAYRAGEQEYHEAVQDFQQTINHKMGEWASEGDEGTSRR